jgi:hypothetical protein
VAPSPAALQLALAIDALVAEHLATLVAPVSPAAEPDPEWDEAAAAAYLGLSPKTLRKWRSTRSDGPEFVKHGPPEGHGPVGYLRSALDAYRARMTRRHTHDNGRGDQGRAA